MTDCATCLADQQWLRATDSPTLPASDFDTRLRFADLFAGCGGLSFGLIESAGRLGIAAEVALAVERDRTALDVFEANVEVAIPRACDVEDLFDGDLGAALTFSERRVLREVGPVDMLVGGPPCQGNSDLNNRTRREDPRNKLYARMARAAEVLEPRCVLIENVPSVRHDRQKVVAVTLEALEDSGYACTEAIVDAAVAGVPQRRRRHVLVAVRAITADLGFLETASWRCPHVRDLDWAIRDLERPTPQRLFDKPPAISDANHKRIAYLFDKRKYALPNDLRPKCHQSDHSYNSMYGRLRWKEPAQTLTTGFGSMGQGRYVHPSRRRTITPHEAARIQTFPDYFDFGSTSRTALGRMIGNAVPPLLNVALGERLLPLLVDVDVGLHGAA